jgi:hypothetical protein
VINLAWPARPLRVVETLDPARLATLPPSDHLRDDPTLKREEPENPDHDAAKVQFILLLMAPELGLSVE